MGKKRTQRKKKRRRRGMVTRKKGGVMLGMRSGFKSVANSVSGGKSAKGKSSWLGTALTVVLILAALALLYYRA
ncbi:MAG TPA: hypothetical protein VFG83_00220 [Kofleriaceae bacterium]|nr:hypothetical protein [Kofleriaceae bacterium]